MANIDGLPVNSAVTHAEFISRTEDSGTVAKISLQNSDVVSGAAVTNVQRAINKSFEGVGATGETDTTINTYSSNNYIVDGDNRKVAIGKLDTQLLATQTQLAALDAINSQDVTAAAIGSTPNANGFTVGTNQVVNLEPANGSFGGVVTTAAQTFAGNKTFANDVIVSGNETVSGTLGVTGLATVGSLSVTGAATINGDLTVNGTTTTVNSATVDTVDPNITVNKNGNNASSEGAGFTVDRTGAKGSLIYANASPSRFKAGDFGSEIELVNLSSTQTLTNKSISGSDNTLTNIPLASAVTGLLPIANGGTGQTTAIAGFNALSPISAKGDLISNDGTNDVALAVGTDAFVLTADSTTASGLKWAASTGGSGGAMNLITNGSADNATVSIFTPYLNTAQSRPVTGAGGSPTVTTSLSSTAPLTGTKSFILSKTAVNSIGQGWAATFSVDPSYRAKSLKISGDYIVSSGTFAAGNNSTPSDGDVIWYLYDITNSQLIEPSNIKMFSSSTTISDSFQATFQTSVTGSSYRLIAHVASTSALAFDLKVDNITVSPQVYVYGTPVTDSALFSSTLSNFGNATQNLYVKRDGGEAVINGVILIGTTAPTGTLVFSLPSGLTIDNSKTGVTLGSINPMGTAVAYRNSTGATFSGEIIQVAGSTNTFQVNTPAGAATVWNATVPQTWANASTDRFYVHNLRVPIVGWSSSVQMSDSADTRVVAAKYNTSSTSVSNGATTVIINTTKEYDTHGAYSTGTGLYTVQSSGKYEVAFGFYASAATGRATGDIITARINKNGSPINIISTLTSWSSAATINSLQGRGVVDALAGDTLAIAINNPSSTFAGDGTSTGTWVSFTKIQGPQSIAASESVNCRYTNTAGTSITNSGADIVVPFATKDYDTHGAFVTDTFTAPIAGKYEVSASLSFSGSLYAAGNQYYATVYKNGSLHSYGIIQNIMAAVTINIGSVVTTTVNCIAGDAIVVRISNNRTAGATALSTTAGVNHLEIKRIGN